MIRIFTPILIRIILLDKFLPAIIGTLSNLKDFAGFGPACTAIDSLFNKLYCILAI